MIEHVFSAPKETVLGDPLVAGYYRVTIAGAVEKNSKAGNPMIELTVRVDEPTRFVGRNMRDYLVFGPKTGWKIDQVLAAIGVSGEQGAKMKVSADMFIGESGIVRVEMEPDDAGKEWPRIKGWLWGDRAEEAELGPFEKFTTAAKSSVADTKVPAAVTTELADDDIPF